MTIADRKEREREERKMQIITAAEHLFFQNGYDQVSMEQIARDAELSKGTIFFYFKNKEALFISIVLRGIRLFHQMVSRSMEGDGPAVSRLYTMGKAVIRFSREYPGYLSLIGLFKSGRFPLECRAGADKEVDEIIRHDDELTRTMEMIVRSGIEEGSIRDDMDPVELAIMIRMMISCVMNMSPEIQWSLKKYGIEEDILIAHYMDLVESVIRGPAPLHKTVINGES